MSRCKWRGLNEQLIEENRKAQQALLVQFREEMGRYFLSSDYFHFIGDKYHMDMNNYYVQNKQSLEKFCDYFIERAAKLLAYSEKEK